MFTGIIESTGQLQSKEQNGSTVRFTINSELVTELQIDQSVAHDGVCLTVVELSESSYCVDVIQETLNRTNLGTWEIGKRINLERSLSLQQLVDGHLVQGHVDTTMQCIKKQDLDGSWIFSFQYEQEHASLLIQKGSVCINGVSLTIAELLPNQFSVAIIPYTYMETNFSQLHIGDDVNIEFDVIGKYINRIAETRK